MSRGAITISSETFVSLPIEVQSLILDAVLGKKQSTMTEAEKDFDPHFAQLSLPQAKEFLQRAGGKSSSAIEFMVSQPSGRFMLADLAKCLDEEIGDLRTLWGGLTRLTKRVTGDSDAYLITWKANGEIYDDAGAYIDHEGHLSERTFTSFKKLLAE